MAGPNLNAKVSGDSREFDAMLKNVDKSVKKTGGGFKSLTSKIAKGFTIAQLGMKAFNLALSAVQQMATMPIKLAGEMEQINIAFTTFLGSATKAKAIIKDLLEFSVITPFTPEEVISSGRTLLAFGVDVKSVVSDLRMLGDVSSATGKDLGELTNLYGKISAAGRLMGREIRQFTSAGIPITRELAKAIGVDEKAIRQLASEGLIAFEDVKAAFRGMTKESGDFYRLTEKQSKTLFGRWSTAIGVLNASMRNTGNMLVKPLTMAVNQSIRLLNFIVAIQTTIKDISHLNKGSDNISGLKPDFKKDFYPSIVERYGMLKRPGKSSLGKFGVKISPKPTQEDNDNYRKWREAVAGKAKFNETKKSNALIALEASEKERIKNLAGEELRLYNEEVKRKEKQKKRADKIASAEADAILKKTTALKLELNILKAKNVLTERDFKLKKQALVIADRLNKSESVTDQAIIRQIAEQQKLELLKKDSGNQKTQSLNADRLQRMGINIGNLSQDLPLNKERNVILKVISKEIKEVKSIIFDPRYGSVTPGIYS